MLWRVEGNQWFSSLPYLDGEQIFWQPGPEAQKTLQALVGRLKATPSATATSVPAIPATNECRGLTVLGRSRADRRCPVAVVPSR